MEIKARVHGVGPATRSVQVEYNGETITAQVPLNAVEFVSDDAGQSNPVLYMTLGQAEEFPIGADVIISITAADAPASKGN